MPLALPLIPMIAGHGADDRGLGADDWFEIQIKLMWILAMLRDRWEVFDLLSLVPIFGILYVAARSASLRFAALVGWPALFCLAAFLLLPRLLMGGAYIDMRMAPAVAMLAIVAIAPPQGGNTRFGRMLAVAGLAFFLVRLGGTTVSFVERSAEQQRELVAVSAIPRGAAVLTLVSRPCDSVWTDKRRGHLSGVAIVRRDIFVNGQWALAGQQLLHIRHRIAAPYLADPSQLVLPASCKGFGSNFAKAIAEFPRAAFTHVWTIGFPPGAAKAKDLRPVWTNGESTLYRVVR